MTGPEAAKNSLVFLLLLAAARTDIREMRIPNRLIGTAALFRIPLFLAEWKLIGKEAVITGVMELAGSMALLLGLLLFAALSRQGLGFGDVKLLGVMALYQGAEEALLCLLYGLIPAACISLILLAVGRISPRDKLPLAPFFLIGFILFCFRKSC